MARQRRPRRARWRAEVTKNGKRPVNPKTGKPIHVDSPGHTAQEAIDNWNRQGYVVHSTPVKMRRGEATGGTKRRPPNQWYVNRKALDDAIETMGLRCSVEIKQTNHHGGRRGAYRPSPGGVHRITIKSWLDYEQASKTLWHELRHAWQTEKRCEAEGFGDILILGFAMMKEGEKGVGYFSKAYERDARAFADRAAPVLLTKPTPFAIRR